MCGFQLYIFSILPLTLTFERIYGKNFAIFLNQIWETNVELNVFAAATDKIEIR